MIIFFSWEGTAQSRTLHASVYSQLNSSPIEYATLAIKDSNKGTFSDASGKFTITCQRNDSLIISALGYKTQVCSCQQEKIYLDTSVIRLEEVVIRPLKSIRHNLGYLNKKKVGDYAGYNATLCFMENKTRKKCMLAKANFLIYKSWLFDGPLKAKFHRLLVRLLIYNSKPHTEDPGNMILRKNITEEVEPTQKKVLFDMSGLGINFPPDGLFIGIEFLGYMANGKFTPFSSDDKNKFIQYNVAVSRAEGRSRSWIRNDYGDRWKLIRGYGRPEYNFNFGLEVLCDR